MVNVKAHERSMLSNEFGVLCKEYNLNATQGHILGELFAIRFPEERDTSYIREWCRRIKEGRAYASADGKTAEVLHNAGLREYVVIGYRKEDGSVFDSYGSFPDRRSAYIRYSELEKESDRMKMTFKIEDGHTIWHKFR
jgi:hypothetical protein